MRQDCTWRELQQQKARHHSYLQSTGSEAHRTGNWKDHGFASMLIMGECQDRWSAYRERFRTGEWRTLIFLDMILDDVRRFPRPTTFLDIGCGKGFDLQPKYQETIARHCDRFLGVEPDASIPVGPFFHEIFRCKFEDARIESGSVNLAFAVMVLEHVDDPARFWNELNRVLVAGGVFWGFTVDTRHYFAMMARCMDILRLKQRYLKRMHVDLGDGGFEHYPTRYRTNSPRQIRKHVTGFRRCDFVNFYKVGQLDYYLPRWFRRPGRLMDRALMATGWPGSLLAVRLEK